jgi:hypothetical protein
MSLPFLTSTESHGDGRSQRNQVKLTLLILLVIAAIAGGGGLLSHLVEPPKAIFLILLAMFVWSIGGWFVGGWRPVLAGLAALAAALAASNSDYFLSSALSGLLFAFLSTHVQIVNERR